MTRSSPEPSVPSPDDPPTAPSALCLAVLRHIGADQFRSGEAIADAVGRTRATVWNAVAEAERFGVAIVHVRGRGYRLAEAVDWLDAARVREALGPRSARFELEVLDACASTSSVLLARAASLPSGHVVATEAQTAGRGRLGRSWHSRLGDGLAFSLLWRFPGGAATLSGLSLAVGLGVLRGIEAAGIDGIRLKWPNDLVWNGRKVGGILIELAGDMLGPTAAVVGIGLNVHMPPEQAAGIGQPATGLMQIAGARPSRNRLLGAVLGALADVLDRFAREGFAALRSEWEAASAMAGADVVVDEGERGARVGRYAGVDDAGALRIVFGGIEQRVVSGDVRVRIREAAAGSAA
jgi:BirA family biotin operon repressor/biotin-[acetyl-CoA-carboxylase] ligase